jgi:hypothetical protein
VAIVKDSSVVYFGPYNAAAINKHMPVDHMVGATVEGKESATAPAAADKVCKLIHFFAPLPLDSCSNGLSSSMQHL